MLPPLQFDPARTKYLRDASGHQMQWYKLYLALGLDPNKHLPEMGLDERLIGNVRVWVLSRQAAVYLAAFTHNAFVHRVRAVCPHCDKRISAGRLSQHLKVHPEARRER